MKSASTLFLKIAVTAFGLLVLSLCVFILPKGIVSDLSGLYRPILIGMYIPAIPFFIGIFHFLKLLNNIDRQKAFSIESIKSLKIIKNCGIIISLLYALGMPYIFYVADIDDAPGVVLLGLVFTFAPLVIAVISAVLQKLLSNAMEIKLENEQLI